VEQLLELYKTSDMELIRKKIKVTFRNEEGDDFGGLTKEIFTIFWEVTYI